MKEFYGPRKGRLIENFVNWPTEEEEILRFTRLYGPLFDKADPGKTFRFSVASWGDAYGGNKNVYRQLWELSKNEKCPDWEVKEPGQIETVSYRKGHLVFKVAHLYFFLYLDVVTCSA